MKMHEVFAPNGRLLGWWIGSLRLPHGPEGVGGQAELWPSPRLADGFDESELTSHVKGYRVDYVVKTCVSRLSGATEESRRGYLVSRGLDMPAGFWEEPEALRFEGSLT